MAFGRKKEDGTDDAGEHRVATRETTTGTAPNAPGVDATADKSASADPKSEEAGTAPKLTDAELAGAPQHVKDAAARMGGSVPRAAPKGGEGTLGRAVESPYPELEPPTPPAEFRAAPTAPGDAPEREAWDGGGVKLADLEAAGAVIQVRTRDPRSAGVYAGGVRVLPEAHDVQVDLVRARSAGHLAQLLADPSVEVRVKPTK